jgi:4-hydroxy-tetrahydrodipicolinate synthase
MTTPAPFGRLLTAMVTPSQKMGRSTGLELKLLQHILWPMAMMELLLTEQLARLQPQNPLRKRRLFVWFEIPLEAKLKFYLVPVIMKPSTQSIKQSELKKAGADGLLVVTPYYNKPPQAGIEAHFRAVADATDLPMMIYDIPGRTGVPIEPDTIVRLAEHPKIVALKDAKGDVASTSWVIKRCGIPVYSGDDILNLPLLSVGAVGFVSVCGHTAGKDLRELLDAWFAGNAARALEIHQKLLPVYTGTFRTQGAILQKQHLL